MNKEYITVGVLAGSYKGNGLKKNMLTHTITSDLDGGGDGYSLCKRIKADHLADSNGGDKNAKPTCLLCFKKDPRFNNLITPNI